MLLNWPPDARWASRRCRATRVAEQAFASGCELLVSGVTSAGQTRDLGPPPYHTIIVRALRDEGEYEKGASNGAEDSLAVVAAFALVAAFAHAWLDGR